MTEINELMRKKYTGSPSLIISMILLVLPVFATAANDTQVHMVTEGVSTEHLEEKLQMVSTATLKDLLENPERRLQYMKGVYSNQKLEQSIVENGLNQGRALQNDLQTARHEVLLNALIQHEFKKVDEDLVALAKERYEANPELYMVRKRIKIALIFIEKQEGQEDQAKSEIESIVAQLNEDPNNNRPFFDLAIKHSDDKTAAQGGANKKWLIAPLDLEKSKPILKASFALDRPGQMTDIIETRNGFSIVRLLKVRHARLLSFEETKPEGISKIRSQLNRRKKAEVMKSLRADDDLPIEDEAVIAVISATYTSRTSNTPGN